MNDYAKQLGERIRFYRKKQGLSQDELSELCDLHPTYIGQLERGEKKASIDTIMRIGKGLGVAPTLLLEKIEYETEPSVARQAYDIFMKIPPEKQEAMLELLKKAYELI